MTQPKQAPLIDYNKFSIEEIEQIKRQTDEAINQRRYLIEKMVKNGDVAILRDYFNQYPNHIETTLNRYLNDDFVSKVSLEQVSALEDIIQLAQEQNPPVKLYANSLTLGQSFVLRGFSDKHILKYALKKDMWTKNILELAKTGVWLNLVKDEDTVRLLDEHHCIDWSKTLMEQVNYNTVFVKYAMKKGLVNYTNDEVLDIYLKNWYQMSGELTDYFYHNHLQGKIEHMSLKDMFFATDKNKSGVIFHGQNLIRLDNKTFEFIMIHHKPDESYMKFMLEEMQDLKKTQMVIDNFKKLCHVVFSTHPDLSEVLYGKLHELSALKQDGQLYHLAKKIEHYEKIVTIAENAQKTEVEKIDDTQTENSVRKIKI